MFEPEPENLHGDGDQIVELVAKLGVKPFTMSR
jgi:hypothetical protein